MDLVARRFIFTSVLHPPTTSSITIQKILLVYTQRTPITEQITTMTDHTYLRYECADAFGIAVDTSLCISQDDAVLTTAGSHVLSWNLSTACMSQKLAPPSTETMGSGQALTSEQVTALCSSGDKVATGWNTGVVRVFLLQNDDKKVVHSILQDDSGLTEPLVVLQGHETAVNSLAFFHDSTKLASGGSNGAVVVWDLVAETGLFRLLGHARGVTSLAFWKDHYLLSTSLDGLVKIWDLQGQCCTQTIASHNGQVWSGSLVECHEKDTADEQQRWRFVTGSVNGQVRVWKVDTPKRLTEGETDDAIMEEENAEEDNNKDDVCRYMGSLLAPPNVTTSNERIASLHQFGGKYVGVLHHNSKTVQIYQIRSSEEALRKKQRRLRRRREKQGKPEPAEKGPKRGIMDDEEPQLEEEVGDSLDQSLEADMIKASDEFEYYGVIRASHKIKDFSFTAPSKGAAVKVVCALSTNALEVHVLKKKANEKNVKVVTSEKLSVLDMYGHPTGIRSVALSSDDVLACTVSKNVTKIWNVAKRSCIQSLTPTEQTYGLCVAFLPGNTHVVVGTREGHLLIIDLNSGDVVFMEEKAHDGAIWSLDVRRTLREGETIAIVTGSADKTVKFWDVEAQEEAENHPMVVHTRTLQMSDDVVAVRYSHSPTKRLVFVSTLDSIIKVFFDDSLKFFLSLYGHKLPALAVDASDDDAILASSGADKTIKIWGLDFGDTHRTLYGHEDSVTDLKFVKRTHNFFTTSKDGTVRYWDGDRFEQILLLNGHSAEVNCLAISRTGAFVMSGGMDRQVRVWERTQDIVFLEEERERQLEQMFDKVSRQDEATSTILKKKRNEDDDDDEQENEDQPQSEAAVKKSVLSISSGDRIMEALERADQELKDTAAFKRSDGGANKERMPNVLLLGLEPAQYILWILRSVKSAELEQSLLVLTMRHMERLVYYLITLLRGGRGVELCSRVSIFMITTHQKQVSVATIRCWLVGQLLLRRACFTCLTTQCKSSTQISQLARSCSLTLLPIFDSHTLPFFLLHRLLLRSLWPFLYENSAALSGFDFVNREMPLASTLQPFELLARLPPNERHPTLFRRSPITTSGLVSVWEVMLLLLS
jgi:U3 small nucleolar RNA-associated protein 12